ncbi:hypothetical protein KY335_02525 [Candidatus Woesearchaeota archaeon]|nr:hypothetical protein [Candidatus Woesearchaeota archaeon]MBW3014094.1 hypothetical protein [Candidatus Woesearchaeota archaeon]
MKKIIIICIIALLLVSSLGCDKALTADEEYEDGTANIIQSLQRALATEAAAEAEGKSFDLLQRYYVELNKIVEDSLRNASTMAVPNKYTEAHLYLINGITIMLDYYPAKIAHAEMIKVAADEETAMRTKLQRGAISQEDFDAYIEEVLEKQNTRREVLTNIRSAADDQLNLFTISLEKAKNS